jgi:hypothetical protein
MFIQVTRKSIPQALNRFFWGLSFLAILYGGCGVYIEHSFVHVHSVPIDGHLTASHDDCPSGVADCHAKAADVSETCTICNFLASFHLQFPAAAILRVFITLVTLTFLGEICSVTLALTQNFRIRGPPQPLISARFC